MANFAGGFDETFVDPPDDEFRCPICLLVARDPILTRCGHVFCEVCFSRLERQGEWVFCPEDRQKLGRGDTFPHNMLKRKILQMRVKCREHANGCEKIVNLKYLEEHLAVCDYVLIPCPNECDEVMPRSALAEHERELCLRRQVQCEHCSTPMEFQEIEDHQLQVCTEFPVTCRLCGWQMARSKIDGHCSVFGDCPKTVIDCEYMDIGCQFKCERELLSAHLQEDAGNHMKLLHQNHRELKENQAKEREEIQRLHKENKELKEHFIDEMKNHLQLLKEEHRKEMQQIKEETRQYPLKPRQLGAGRRSPVNAAATGQQKEQTLITLSCGHTFCQECIDECFKEKPVCPECGAANLTGTQPIGGTMNVMTMSLCLPGYHCGTLEISYYIPPGRQTEEHPHPRRFYRSVSRTAYLPDNKEGREVLRLLRKAFEARLTFTVASSRTTGDQVTWGDIHHKTSRHGGPQNFGYPDPDYLARVKDELKAKGIE